MDFDAWEDTLTSPQSLVKLLAETDRQHNSLRIPSLRRVKDSNQSRFSFARQDDFFNQESNFGHSVADAICNSSTFVILMRKRTFAWTDIMIFQMFPKFPHLHKDFHFQADQYHQGFLLRAVNCDGLYYLTCDGLCGSPLWQIVTLYYSAANHLLQNSAPLSRNAGGSIDVEFMDPATMEAGNGIQAVRMNNSGFDMRPALLPHLGPFNHDMELQMLMQQPISVKQNPRFLELQNRFSPQTMPTIFHQCFLVNPHPTIHLHLHK
ncbi:hypothetical protein GH714_039412 [Hevea brasiliensis]|uniref:Uncharacterized protein n=1 Tax=Hevea brasiliensis TaxID=3981 RepID=A0A6A6KLZ5_HEVBR|nr:hypothetical protein GH714_039412 [Hevea brasiliensis]